MKKILTLVALFLGGFQGFSQEAKLGLTAGYLNLNVSSSFPRSDFSENASGFYAGILGDFKLSDSFYLQPAAIYGNANGSNVLFIPIHAKYYLGESGVSVLAGPQGTLLLDEIDPTIKRIGWDLSFGAEYDITDNTFILIKYAMEITNRYSDEFIKVPAGVNAGINSLLAGIGYKF